MRYAIQRFSLKRRAILFSQLREAFRTGTPQMRGENNVTILAEELNAEVTADEALRCYERRLKHSIEKKRAVGRKMARWFVPENSSRLMMRDFALRLSNWPITSYMVGQSFAGDSIF